MVGGGIVIAYCITNGPSIHSLCTYFFHSYTIYILSQLGWQFKMIYNNIFRIFILKFY